MGAFPTYEKYLGPFDRLDHHDRLKQDARAVLLRQYGWTHASTGHPASGYWLWTREIDGKTYLCDAITATIIARREAEKLVDPSEFRD